MVIVENRDRVIKSTRFTKFVNLAKFNFISLHLGFIFLNFLAHIYADASVYSLNIYLVFVFLIPFRISLNFLQQKHGWSV